MKSKEELERELDKARSSLSDSINALGTYGIVDKYVSMELAARFSKNEWNTILAILLNRVCKLGDVVAEAEDPREMEGTNDPVLVLTAIGYVRKVQRLSKELKSM